MSKLFDMSLDDRRQNFVRARFGEDQVFGREDVEEWVDSQLDSPPESNIWRQIISLHADSSKAGTFWRGQTYLDFLKEHGLLLRHARDPEGLIEEFLSSVRGSLGRPWEVFLVSASGNEGQRDSFILVGPNDETLSFRYGLGERGSLGEQAVLRSHVLLSVLRTWEIYGPPKPFLVDWLKAVISEVREKAEEDFDKAVACSADGRKIVHADEVWVVRKGSYRRSVLQEVPCDCKLLLDTDTYAGFSKAHRNYESELAWLDTLKDRERTSRDILPEDDIQQVGFVFQDKSVFMTDEKYVPEEILDEIDS